MVLMGSEFMGGFFVGVSVTSMCFSIYLMYVGKKLMILSKSLDCNECECDYVTHTNVD